MFFIVPPPTVRPSFITTGTFQNFCRCCCMSDKNFTPCPITKFYGSTKKFAQKTTAKKLGQKLKKEDILAYTHTHTKNVRARQKGNSRNVINVMKKKLQKLMKKSSTANIHIHVSMFTKCSADAHAVSVCPSCCRRWLRGRMLLQLHATFVRLTVLQSQVHFLELLLFAFTLLAFL